MYVFPILISLIIQTQISNLVRTTRFQNDLQTLKVKDWKVK
jgi:hypothetical protein